MAIATEETDEIMSVRGTADLAVVGESAVHQLLVGIDSYRCLVCPDTHHLAILVEADPNGGEQVVVVRSEDEAWAVARHLLVVAFGLVDEGMWTALRGMVGVDAGEMN